ncbi:MAG: NAD(P)H-dependent oxidoreductase subunit E, partial [Deltaproteobacteria bacterium]|nr:NAD(P)H-dependent oxidoreductase subunit E [Deltaproteobacteria bacterium]
MDIELSAEENSLLKQIKADLVEIGNDRSKLIPMLQLVQHKFAYLPAEAIYLVADHLDISSSEVYGVATFYN